MATFIRALARKTLPSSLFYAGRQMRRHMLNYNFQDSYEEAFPSRRDVTRLSIQPGVELHVFWKVLPIGHGPAFSLFMHDEEVLRFDCFGKDNGHYHASFEYGASARQSRLYLGEPSADLQISRVEFELLHNLGYYLQRHPWHRIRSTDIDTDNLKKACDVAAEQARMFLKSVPDLRDLSDRPVALSMV